jgi:hypothetical protein
LRRLVLVLFVVLVLAGVARPVPGAKSTSSSRSQVVDNEIEARFEADESGGNSSYRLDAWRKLPLRPPG